MTTDLEKLQRVLGIRFENSSLLEEALTHKSYADEHHIPYDNQRLELLGDAVVQIILTRYLFDRYPHLQEGDLTKIRSALANQDSLAALARIIQLGTYLRLGKGEIELNGQDRDSTICDAFESFIGALYLDRGLDAATKFLLEILERNCPDPSALLQDLNPKGALQELTQRTGAGTPSYKVVDVSGPDHNPVYSIELSIRGQSVCRASASSRKLAERAAARKALDILRNRKSGETE